MKFLCIPCDSPMKLQTVGPPEGGSLSVVFSCPECGYEMALLTNPFETQLVQSLGVRIGPEVGGGASSAGSTSASGTSCPFPAMIPAMEGALEGTGHATSTGAGAATGHTPTRGEARHVQTEEPIAIRWTSGAEARLEKIPAFVRPMARIGIERFARERGALEVDERILDAAREFFGM
jgi:hypothetical protein